MICASTRQGAHLSPQQTTAGTESKVLFFHPHDAEARASKEGDTINNDKTLGAMIQISQRLTRWPDVTLTPHRYGGLGIFVDGQELGQLHDCGLLDVSLTAVERDALLRASRVHNHHTFPGSGWVTLPIDGLDDVPLAMEALGMAHARVLDAAFPQQVCMASVSPVARGLVQA